MLAFWQNDALLAALISMLAAQILKWVMDWIKTGRFDSNRLWSAGGMPSSHTAMATALAAAFAFQAGVRSAPFAISTTVALIVMYDATAIRYQAGQQASVLNRLVRDLQRLDALPGDIDETRLKELLGHRPLEVFGGTVLGLLVATMVTGVLTKWVTVGFSLCILISLLVAAVRRTLIGRLHRGRQEDISHSDHG